MKSANETLSDNAIRHAVNLLRYERGLRNDIVNLLNASDEQLTDKIAQRLARIEERGVDIGPATTRRMNELLAEIKDINDNVYKQVRTDLIDELTEFAAAEADFQTRSLTTALATVDIEAKTPSPTRLRAIVSQRPLVDGQLLRPFVDAMSTNRQNRIERAIRIGILNGNGTDAIVRSIRGTSRLGFKDGILEISRRSAASIVRTSITAVSNHAQQETLRENEDIVSGWQFTATLDNRTTQICGSNDGQIFEIGQGPIPPLHIGCRSISVAITKSFRELGLDRNEFNAETRASINGQVPASTTFDDFLRRQSKAEQNQILGPTKADLYRSGRLELKDFVRNNREIISLAELRTLHPQAFN